MTPRATPPLPRHQATVEAVLIGAGWEYVVTVKEGVCYTFVFFGPHDHTGHELVLVAGDGRPGVTLQLHLSTFPSEATRAETALLLGWLNGRISRASFVLGESEDEVILRGRVDEGLGTPVDVDTLDAVIDALIDADARFMKVIADVAGGRCTATTALQATRADTVIATPQ